MHNAPSPANRLSRRSQTIWVLLLVAFAWLQFAGMAHKYAHQYANQQLAAHQAAQVLGSETLQKIFPHHSQQDKSDCQLFDLQCSGVALSQPMPVLDVPVFVPQALWHKAAPFSTSAWLIYQARAPPNPLI